MSNLDPVSEDHELQVQSFLRFAKMKRGQHVREVLQEVKEVKEFKLDESVYPKPDVEDILDNLCVTLEDVIEKEFTNEAYCSALLLRLLFIQAEGSGLELSVDTNALENEMLLGEIENSEKAALSKPASAFVKKASKLQKVTGGSGTDPRIIRERDDLKEEVATLKERFNQLQAQNTVILREKTALQEQLDGTKGSLKDTQTKLEETSSDREAVLQKKELEMKKLEEELTGKLKALEVSQAELQASSSSEVAAVEKSAAKAKKQLAAIQDELRVKALELEKAEQQVNEKLNDSKQFQQMKKMMQAKSQQVVQLRKRLACYEPPDADAGDADADM